MAFFGRSERLVSDHFGKLLLLAALYAVMAILFTIGMMTALSGWNGEQGEQEVVTVRCSNPAGLQAVEMRVRKDYTTLSHDGFLYRNNSTGTTIVYNSAPGEMCVLHAGGMAHEQDYIGDKAE